LERNTTFWGKTLHVLSWYNIVWHFSPTEQPWVNARDLMQKVHLCNVIIGLLCYNPVTWWTPLNIFHQLNNWAVH
jgi:hypothetical protein